MTQSTAEPHESALVATPPPRTAGSLDSNAVAEPTRSRAVRYGIAIAAMALGVAVAQAFQSLTGPEFYAPLIGAAAVAVWFGGPWPALIAVVGGWGYELVSEVEFASGLDDTETRWLAGLTVALAVVWMTSAMRSAASRSAAQAEEATRAGRETERLQALVSQLSAAATPAEVARALVERGVEALSADGGALALVVGDELEILDPETAEPGTAAAGSRVPLEARTVLSEAVRSGELRAASTAAELADRYPDGLGFSPATGAGIAVPVRVAGDVVGAIGFDYGRSVRVDDENLALACVAADLGGQALERARLYQHERALREGLDRALRVTPQAGGGSPEEVAAGICREARKTFGSDVALMLSILDERRFVVDWREPPSAMAATGLVLAIEELPDLAPALAGGTVMWVPDMLESLRGEALAIAQTLGTISALRIPITLAGRVDRVLVVQWETRVSDPTPASLALARRFADQAGLALEQAERRAAEELAERRAEEARRLLETTTALAAAISTTDVVDVVLDHGALAVGADAGVVALREGDELVVIGTAGVEPEDVVRRIPLAEGLPLADAVRRIEVVVVESAEDLRRRYPLLGPARAPLDHPASVSVPLAGRGAAIGGMAFGFERPRRVDEAQRQLVAAIARQASAALERARLHESERAARTRAERSAARLAQLHALGIALARARTEAAVAEAVGLQITGVLGARGAALYVVDLPEGVLRCVGRTGAARTVAGRDEVPLTSELPLATAASSGEAVWSSTVHNARASGALSGAGDAAAWGVVPMIVEGQAVGALEVSFEDAALLDPDARRFVETVARYAGQPLERVRLLEDERVARLSAEDASRRTNRLQAATEALAAAVSISEVAETALHQAAVAMGADAGLLYLRSPRVDHAVLAASTGLSTERAAELSRLELSEASPVTDVITMGAHVVELPSNGDMARRYPVFAARLGQSLPGGVICTPVSFGLVTVGAFLLFGLDGRPPGREEVDLLLTLGRQSAQALDRARLLEAEQAAARRLQRLHAITAALSGAVSVEAVGRATLDEAAPALGASEGAVVVHSGAETVDVVASMGPLGQVRGLALSEPLAEVLHGRRPVWELETSHARRYPLPRTETGAPRGWAALPLVGTRAVVGALVLGFDEGRGLDAEDRAWLLAAAAQCAQAIERSRLYDAERAMRERVERLQRLTARLSTSLTPSEVAMAVLSAGQEALGSDKAALVGAGDGVALDLIAADGEAADLIADVHAAWIDQAAPVTDVIRSQRPTYLESRDAIVDRYPRLGPAVARLEDEAWALAPLIVGGRAVAALAFGWFRPQTLVPERRLFIETLARQGAQALDRARKHQSERQIAETLQRSMLPDRLPEVAGVELAARYVPGTAGMEVGGDWFDVVPLENGRIGLAVGDVVGKGVRAASTMGQLRNALRAFALEQLRPATAVSRLNALVDTFADVPFATLVYLTLDPVRRVCRYTTAGHLPPIVLRPDGTVERLEGGRSFPLGVDVDAEFAQSTTELEPGSTIVLYTDGLVERPGSSLEDGLGRLEESLRGSESITLAPPALADRVLAVLLAEGDPRDDVALLIVKLAQAGDDSAGRPANGSENPILGTVPSRGTIDETEKWPRTRGVS